MKFFACLVVMLVFPSFCWGEDMSAEIGLRGATATGNVQESYSVVEVYLQKDLPWQLTVRPGVRGYLRLDGGVGYLETSTRTGGWVALGGDAVLGFWDGFWEIEVGFRPMILSEHKFARDDFGGPVQFSSHVGTTARLDRLSVGYRYQHVSNAGFYDTNPGLDLHLVGVGYRF